MKTAYFCTGRDIFQYPLFKNAGNPKLFQFFMFCQSMAMFKDTVVDIHGTPTPLRMGQFWTTHRLLARQFGTSKATIGRWFQILEREGLISQTTGRDYTIVSIRKYLETADTGRQTEKTRAIKNQEKKNIKNFVSLERVGRPGKRPEGGGGPVQWQETTAVNSPAFRDMGPGESAAEYLNAFGAWREGLGRERIFAMGGKSDESAIGTLSRL